MRVLVRTVSELCITVGTLIVLFVVYVLFWTGIKADSATDGQIDRLERTWAKAPVEAPAAGAAPKRALCLPPRHTRAADPSP